MFIYRNVFVSLSVVNKLEGFLQRKGTNKEQVLSLTGDYMHDVMETGVCNVRNLLKNNSQKVCHSSILPLPWKKKTYCCLMVV